jgi:hypothetical protein
VAVLHEGLQAVHHGIDARLKEQNVVGVSWVDGAVWLERPRRQVHLPNRRHKSLLFSLGSSLMRSLRELGRCCTLSDGLLMPPTG